MHSVVVSLDPSTQIRRRKRPLHWTPKYRLHKPSGRAIVTIGDKDHYLGVYGSKESHQEYDRQIAEWRANGREAPAPPGREDTVTVLELVSAFYKHAKQHYRDEDGPTSELGVYKTVLRLLRKLYGRTRVAEFTPKRLQVVQKEMVARGWKRKSVNQKINRIRHVFKWGIGEGLVRPELHAALKAVEGLRRGQHSVKDSRRVQPVTQAQVDITLPHLSRQVRAIVQLEQLTGARGGELLIMRPMDIDMRPGDEDRPWVYCPRKHKNQHRDQGREIHLGKKCQEIIRPFLADRRPDAYLFSPVEAEDERREEMRRTRTSKVQPSQVERGRRAKANASKRLRPPGDHYTACSYRKAIERACDSAKVDVWTPHRLRHKAITEISMQFTPEHAKAMAGHQSLTTTAIYDHSDRLKAAHVARTVG